MPTQPLAIALDDYDAIIFDFGGVILRLDYAATVSALSAVFDQDLSFLYSQVRQAALFDAYERGELSTAEFRRGLVELLPQNRDAFLERLTEPDFGRAIDRAWGAMLLDLPDENLQLLRRLKVHKQTYLLSNTNAAHLEQFRRGYEATLHFSHGDFDAHFHATYFSHEMGQRKPEPGIFQAVITNHQLDPSRTLFIDDNLQNLDGARSVGLRVTHHDTNAPLSGRFLGI